MDRSADKPANQLVYKSEDAPVGGAADEPVDKPADKLIKPVDKSVYMPCE